MLVTDIKESLCNDNTEKRIMNEGSRLFSQTYGSYSIKSLPNDGVGLNDKFNQIPQNIQHRLHTPIKLKIRNVKEFSMKLRNEKIRNNQLRKDIEDIYSNNNIPNIFLIPSKPLNKLTFETKSHRIIAPPVTQTSAREFTLNMLER